jgi:hypothetical protein
MVFGETSRFAIEAIAQENPPLKGVCGRMRIWCQGIAIGDFTEELCGLYGAYDGFCQLEQLLPQNWRDEFENLTDADIWNLLDFYLYGYHGDVEVVDDTRTLEALKRDAQVYGRFDFLTNWGEQFDEGGKSFILCRPSGKVNILNQSLPNSMGLSLETDVDAVFAAIRAFRRWYEYEERLILANA